MPPARAGDARPGQERAGQPSHNIATNLLFVCKKIKTIPHSLYTFSPTWTKIIQDDIFFNLLSVYCMYLKSNMKLNMMYFSSICVMCTCLVTVTKPRRILARHPGKSAGLEFCNQVFDLLLQGTRYRAPGTGRQVQGTRYRAPPGAAFTTGHQVQCFGKLE